MVRGFGVSFAWLCRCGEPVRGWSTPLLFYLRVRHQGRSYKMARPLTGVPRLVRTAVCGGVLPARAVHTSPTFLGPAGDPKVPADDTKTGGTGFFGVRLPLPATLTPLTVPGIILRVKGSQRRRPDSFTIRTTLQTRRTREIRP